MQVSAYCKEEITVGFGMYKGEEGEIGMGWIDIHAEAGNSPITLHCVTPGKLRELGQRLFQIATSMTIQKEKQPCQPKN